MIKNINLVPMTSEHVADMALAYAESFESLRLFYAPAWSKFEKLPGKIELNEMITGWIDENDRPEGIAYAVFGESNQLVGFGEFHHIDWSVPKGRIGYWVRKGFEGQGIATEIARKLTKIAFEELGFARLEIRSEIRNTASRKIAEKLGYDYIGVFYKNKSTGQGKFWDLDIFARLNAEGL